MIKPKKYTRGFEDAERTLDTLKERQRKERRKEWLATVKKDSGIKTGG